MPVTPLTHSPFRNRAIRITSALIVLMIASILISGVVLNQYDSLHGVKLRIENREERYPDLRAAIAALPEHTTAPAVISFFVPMERCSPCLIALRAPARTKLWIGGKPVFQKAHQMRSSAFITQQPGLTLIRMAYHSGPRVLPVELSISSDLATSIEFSRRNCYFSKIDQSKLRVERSLQLISATSRLLLLLIVLLVPVYLFLRPKAIPAIRSNPLLAIFIAVSLMLFAFLRIQGLNQQLVEGIHPDERLIQNMVNDVHGIGLAPRSFWYTTGFVYSTAAFDSIYQWITQSNPPAHLAARTLSAIASTISCLLVYFIALKLTNRTAATFAFVLFGLLYMPVYLAHFGIIEPFLVCLFLAAFLSMVHLQNTQSMAMFAAAGIFTGLSVGTKQTAAILALPMILIMIQLIRSGRFPDGIAKPVLFFLISAGAAYMLFAPYTILDFSTFVRYQQRQFGDISGSSNNSLLFMRSGSVPGFQIVIDNIRRGIGIPILFTAVAGAFFLFRKSIVAGLLTAGFAAVYFVILLNSSIIPYHYVLLLVPFLSMLSGYLLFEITRLPRITREVLIVSGLLLILFPSIRNLVLFEKAVSSPDTRRAAAAWCYKNLPANSRVDFELFGPRFLLPAFDDMGLRLFARQRLEKYLSTRHTQYYIQDSLSIGIFVKQGPEIFPRQNEWLKWIQSNATRIAEFHGHSVDLHNPDIVIYKLPDQ